MKGFPAKDPVFDPELNESYVPYVIETSIGVDRMFLSVLCSCYEMRDLGGGDSRAVLHFRRRSHR